MNLNLEMDKFKHSLDEWEKSIGLPQRTTNYEHFHEIINMSKAELEALSKSDASDNVFILSQLSLDILRRSNKCYAFIEWANNVIGKTSLKDTDKLNHLVRLAKIRIKQIQYVANKIEFMGQSMMVVAKSRD